MESKIIHPGKAVELFVKSIMIFEEKSKTKKTILPFFADGYPGLMFQETKKGLFVNPHNKRMPDFFLYGQTIKPIELVIEGSYKLIVFQLYPFVLKSFFNVDPKSLNDDCYNLAQLKNETMPDIIETLKRIKSAAERIEIITSFLHSSFQTKRENLDFKIRQSLQLIIENKGQLTIAEMCDKLNLNERTFERRFLNEVGVSPKQFSIFTRFQQSLDQLSLKDHRKLTDIVYDNGFADQSHFIRVFKAFTGKTPKRFKSSFE